MSLISMNGEELVPKLGGGVGFGNFGVERGVLEKNLNSVSSRM